MTRKPISLPRHIRTLAILLCGALLLSACSGWQLRGDLHSPRFEALTLQGGSARLHYTLERQLGTLGVPLHAEARYVVHITDERLQDRTAAVDSQGREAERELTYEITWQLIDSKTGAVLNPPRHIMSMRSFAYYPDNVTASSDEQTQVETELFDDVSYRLINQLADASRKIQPQDL